MSRIFYGDNPKDVQDLMAFIRVNPQIKIEMDWTEEFYKTHKREYKKWTYRGTNHNVFGGLKPTSENMKYRIKES